MQKMKYLPWIAAAGFAASLVMVLPAFAQTQGGMMNGPGGHFGMRGNGMAPGVVGIVTAVNGSTLTVTSKMKPHASSTVTAMTGTVFTVDAANARIVKNGATSTIASIVTGDMVAVQGTVSGTNVTATVIREGKRGFGRGASSTMPSMPPIQGNGQPVIGGSVTSVGSATLTVTNASNVTYTIDASTAKIVKNGTGTALAGVAMGDNVIVQGRVNGTSVTASSIIDQGSGNHGDGTAAGAPSSEGAHSGFFGSIGNFFRHLFGF